MHQFSLVKKSSIASEKFDRVSWPNEFGATPKVVGIRNIRIVLYVIAKSSKHNRLLAAPGVMCA